MSTIKIVQTRSCIGSTKKQKDTLKALGLKKIGWIVEVEDTPATQGMIGTVSHLISIEETSPS